MQVSNRLACRELDLSDPELRGWVRKMQGRMPQALRDISPGTWLGLYYEDRLFSAMRYVHRADGSVFIDGLVCHPSKLGRQYAVALWLTLRALWGGRTIVFCVSLTNRKMLKALQQYTNAHPVAAVFEMEVPV
jgi:hypothetical protein